MQTKSPSTTLPFFYKSTHFLTLSLNLETYSGLFFFSFALLFNILAVWCRARGIIVPLPGIEPGAPTFEGLSPNHRMIREVPPPLLFFQVCLQAKESLLPF